MASKSFVSKFPDTVCVRCDKKIEVGAEIRFARPGSKDKEHANACPGVPQAPTLPTGSTLVVPRIGETPTPHPPFVNGPGDAPIYTYHRRVNVWQDGLLRGFVEEGVSVKGREITAIERVHVDDAAVYLVNRDEFGRLRK